MKRVAGMLSVVAVFVACAGPEDAPVRSPARDYRPEPVRTSDGQVLGADGKDPSALLEEQGTTDHAAPGWTLDEDGLKYDPKRPAGHSDAAAVPPEHKGHGGKGAK
jgi:hypothetical protein